MGPDAQERFCIEYLKCFNATQAYKSVYPSSSHRAAESSAARLLVNAKVQAYLNTLRDRVSVQSEASLERVIKEVSRIAFADITDVLSFNEDGVLLKHSKELPEGVTAAIEAIALREVPTKDGVNRKLQIKLHDKVAALQMLGDFYGIFDDFNRARATLLRYGLAVTARKQGIFQLRLSDNKDMPGLTLNANQLRLSNNSSQTVSLGSHYLTIAVGLKMA
ncbi:MAG: terminase small subunit [Cyanobacteria bacterium P01_D01_bin.36]